MHNGDALSEKEIRPYRDFVEEDAEHIGSASFQKGADFWNDKFETLPESLPFNGSKKGFLDWLWLCAGGRNRVCAYKSEAISAVWMTCFGGLIFNDFSMFSTS